LCLALTLPSPGPDMLLSCQDRMEIKLRRQLKHDKKDIGTRLDQKNRYRSSLKKLDPPVYQIGVSVFIEKTYAQNIF
jgi:hypothetical protein